MEDTSHFVLRMPANLSFQPIASTILPNSTFSIQLDVIKGNTSWLDSIENRPADMVLRKGLLLTSDSYVTCYYDLNNGSNPALFSLKGKNGVGTEFYISGQTDYANQTNDGSEAFDIVATQDATTITITPSITIVGHAANVPFQVTLNKGETYSARTLITTASASLAGSHVVSDKPIAITISDDSIVTGGWDIIGDQTVPVNLLGSEYIVIKGFADNVPPNNDDERAYITATQNFTDITVDGVSAGSINIGQQYDYPIPSTTNTAFIKTTKPVYVYHLSGHPGEAGSSILPPDSCTGSKKIGFNRSSTSAFALLILTRNGNQNSFLLNGNSGIITGANFNVVPGTGNNWVYYRQNNLSTVQVPVGANILENTQGKFHLGILNNVAASSEYGYFSDFSTLYLGADASMCPGDSMILDGGPYRTSYDWKKLITGIWIQVGTSRTFIAKDTGYYACMTNGDFCTLMDTIHIAFYPNGTVSLGADRTICQGTTTTISAGNNYVTYQWSNGATTSSVTALTPGSYWVRVTNNNGCIARDTMVIHMDSLPMANHPVTGPASVCQGENNAVYATDTLHFANTYAWTLPPGSTGASTTNSITLNFSVGAITGDIKVHGINQCGNGPDVIFPIVVNPLPLAAGAISGPLAICQGQSGISFSVLPVPNATSYTWTLPAGCSVAGGAGTNSVIVDAALNAASGSITVTGHNGCGDGGTSNISVTVNQFPEPAGPVTGIATLCQGQSGLTYSVPAIPGADSYTWTLPSGASITSGNGTNAIVVSLDLSALSGNITVRGHSTNCGDGVPSSYALTVNPFPSPAGSITGPSSVCQGQSGNTWSIPVIPNASSYTWNLPSGCTVTAGAGTNSITVNFGLGAVSGTISVAGHTICGDGTASTITLAVNLFPLPAGPVTGSVTLCQGQAGLSYSVPAITGAGSYIWSLPSGATITSGAGTNSIVVSFDSTALSGSLTVKGHSALCGDGISSSLGITVNPLPSPAGMISGPATVCQGQTGVTWSVQTIANASSYTWTLPAGCNLISGSGTNNITSGFNNNASSGIVTVYGHNAVCGDGRHNAHAVTVNPLPAATGDITGTTTVCQGVTGIPYSIQFADPQTTSYSWNLAPGSAGTVAGQASSVSITYDNAFTGNATLQVHGVNGCGSGPVSQSFNILVNPKPVVSLVSCNDLQTTKNARPVTLKGGYPLGISGSYTGTGVVQAVQGMYVFDPGNSAVNGSTGGSTYTITYRYTNIYNCFREATTTMKVYSSNASQPCPGSITDPRDGKSYATFLAGSGASAQCWMAENLNYGTWSDASQPQTDNCTVEKYCVNDVAAQCATSGGYYQWFELMNYSSAERTQGICIPGWHIPSQQEWNDLESFYLGAGLAGNAMKDTNVTTGFHGLVSGINYLNNTWKFSAGSVTGAMFWSSTTLSGLPVAIGLNSINPSASLYRSSLGNSFPVRCVKD